MRKGVATHVPGIRTFRNFDGVVTGQSNTRSPLEKMHPATDDLKLIELKRKKLSLKDEMEKLRQEKALAETTH